MAYTVFFPGGNNDSEFQAYVRLLRQNGVDIGNAPRIPDPETQNKWLYVWNSKEEAESFRNDLAEITGKQDWLVHETNAQPSDGPLGPIILLLTRSAAEFIFSMHALSRAMIKSAFPHAKPTATSISVGFETWHDFKSSHGNVIGLIEEIGPTLTGLDGDQIGTIGLQVFDADNDKTVIFIPPTAGKVA